MNKESFLNEFVRLIDFEGEISYETDLYSIDDYDSLTQMGICAWFEEKFTIKCTVSDVDEFETIQDYYDFVFK